MIGQWQILDLPLNDVYRAKEMPATTDFSAISNVASSVPQQWRIATGVVPGDSELPILRQYFDVLYRTYGAQKWWPGRTRFEIIVGAILTQNTNWTNVEQAIRRLRRKELLTLAAIAEISTEELAELIRSSGYFRQKARKLKEFANFVRAQYHGSLNEMFRTPTAVLRPQLLAVHGIGPETADSILLYAGKHQVFVVDAYTRRVLERHELVHSKNTYEEIRGLAEKSLPFEVQAFNEFHALIVHVGKHLCRPKAPVCSTCPLNCFLVHPIEGAI
jgi:endonuclease III related protein